MKNIYSAVNDLNDQQKENVMSEIYCICRECGEHLIEAIRYVNDQAQLAKEDFWWGLFEKDNRGRSILKYTTTDASYEAPEDPYAKLDYLAALKYLYSGGTRPSYQDQKNFLDHFIGKEGEDYYYRIVPQTKSNQLYAGEFGSALMKAIDIRNTYVQANLETKQKLTLSNQKEDSFSIPYILKVMECLIEPLCTVPWNREEQSKCIEFKENLWSRMYKALGEVSYSLSSIMQTLGIPATDRANIENNLREVGIRTEGDEAYIYGDLADVAYALYFAWLTVDDRTTLFKRLHGLL